MVTPQAPILPLNVTMFWKGYGDNQLRQQNLNNNLGETPPTFLQISEPK